MCLDQLSEKKNDLNMKICHSYHLLQISPDSSDFSNRGRFSHRSAPQISRQLLAHFHCSILRCLKYYYYSSLKEGKQTISHCTEQKKKKRQQKNTKCCSCCWVLSSGVIIFYPQNVSGWRQQLRCNHPVQMAVLYSLVKQSLQYRIHRLH